MIKRLFLLVVICCACICVMAQTNTIKHTVDRGETLQTIAKRYATTAAKIIELNPDAKQFVYVGMELAIPVEKSTNVIKEEKREVGYNNLNVQNISDQTVEKKVSDETDFSRWDFAFNIGYGFLPKPKEKGVTGTNFSYMFTFGANYNVTKLFYVGARIGYNFVNHNALLHKDGEYLNLVTNNYMASIPVEAGYRFYLSDEKIALVPYAGVDFNYVVKCKQEVGLGSNKEKKTVKPENRFGANARVGLRLKLWGFDLGGSYVFTLDKNFGENDGYPEISIGFGF